MSDLPKGECDICREKPAKYWYGNTAAKICDNSLCEDKMDEKYEEHCIACDEERKREQEAREWYGYE